MSDNEQEMENIQNIVLHNKIDHIEYDSED